MRKTPCRPICAVTAAILPVATFIILGIVNQCSYVDGFEGFGFAIILLMIWATSVVISLILSIVSLLRIERLWGLALAEAFVYLILSLMVFVGLTSK